MLAALRRYATLDELAESMKFEQPADRSRIRAGSGVDSTRLEILCCVVGADPKALRMDETTSLLEQLQDVGAFSGWPLAHATQNDQRIN